MPKYSTGRSPALIPRRSTNSALTIIANPVRPQARAVRWG
jgi:hypothetical protein